MPPKDLNAPGANSDDGGMTDEELREYYRSLGLSEQDINGMLAGTGTGGADAGGGGKMNTADKAVTGIAGLIGAGEGGIVGRRRRRRAEERAREKAFNEMYDALFGQMSPDERAKNYYTEDGGVNSDKVREEAERIYQFYKSQGATDEFAREQSQRMEEKLFDEVNKFRNSPEGMRYIELANAERQTAEYEAGLADLQAAQDARVDKYGQAEKNQALATMEARRWQDDVMGRYGDTLGGEIQGDPAAYDKRMGALDSLMNVYQQEGMTSADKAAMELARQGAAQASRASREAVARDAAMRGVSGGGMNYINQLAATEQGAGNAARQQMEFQIAARQRAQEALMGAQEGYGSANRDQADIQNARAQAVDDWHGKILDMGGAASRETQARIGDQSDAQRQTGDAEGDRGNTMWGGKGNVLSAQRDTTGLALDIQDTIGDVDRESNRGKLEISGGYGGANVGVKV